MSKIFNALELNQPNFVIKLAQTLGSEAEIRVHTEVKGTVEEVLEMTIPELNAQDAKVTERQLVKIMSECVLPLAMQTKALILMSAGNDCAMATAAAKVLGPVQRRLGQECPFTTVGFGHVAEYHKNVQHNPGSMCAQVSPTQNTICQA
jgi:hypothetical protein